MDEVMQFYKTKLGKDFCKLRCKLWAIQAMGSSDKDSHPFVKQLKTKTIVDMFDAFEIVAHQANDLVTRIQDQVEELSSEKKTISQQLAFTIIAPSSWRGFCYNQL